MAAGGTCSLERVTHISQVIRRRRRYMNPCGGGGGGGAGGGPYRVSRRSRGRATHSAALREHEARVLNRMLEACGGKDSAHLGLQPRVHVPYVATDTRQRAARRTACRAQVAPPALPMATHLRGRGRRCMWHARARFACTRGARAVRHGARTIMAQHIAHARRCMAHALRTAHAPWARSSSVAAVVAVRTCARAGGVVCAQ